MSKGHGVIINLSSYISWVFQYNPTEIESVKKINYFKSPNIGGSSHKNFFTGFENEEVSVELQIINMVDDIGVVPDISFFKQLREPDAGITGIANSFFGNENYPPPQVLFNFGTGHLVPLIYDVMDVRIKATHMKSDSVGGVLGIPKRAVVNLTLSLDEDNALYKMNQVAKKVAAITGSARSIKNEMQHSMGTFRKEYNRTL